MLSTAASLGMLLLWDVDGGLTQIDKYLYSNEEFIKVSEYTYVKIPESKFSIWVWLVKSDISFKFLFPRFHRYDILITIKTLSKISSLL